MMKIRSGYMLRKVIDTYVIMGIGSDNYVPNRIMSLNETGAYLWRLLEKGSDKQALIDNLISEYEVDLTTAEKDVDVFLDQLRDKDLIEE
ncbi:coenzyme PQQ synthesis protein D (PqqD) [Ruminococcaceae bacterium R-25]|nr:coenzyme PQQ synthesis protein D (PqqD) [Ruminococcaceae bacterium R-25]SUQ11274.1 Coenzyme PQQ synthesis protein D (PqqD) [Oscillospiraceae bacterium]